MAHLTQKVPAGAIRSKRRPALPAKVPPPRDALRTADQSIVNRTKTERDCHLGGRDGQVYYEGAIC